VTYLIYTFVEGFCTVVAGLGSSFWFIRTPLPDQQNKLASEPHVALACVCSLGTSIPLCCHLDGASEIRAFFAHFGWKYQMLYSL